MIPIRDEIRSGKFPLITISLIVANIAVFMYQLSLGGAEQYFIWKYAVVAKSLLTFQPLHPASNLPPPVTLVTSQFLHGDIFHLGFNMLFLWIFGDNIEAKLGYLRFPLFYLGCGIISALVQVAVSPNAEVPMIGASGAISGVMGAYFIRFPRAKVQTWVFFFFIIRLPAVIFLGLWLVLQIVAGMPFYGSSEGGVAYFAHIGGFVTGMLAFNFVKKYN